MQFLPRSVSTILSEVLSCRKSQSFGSKEQQQFSFLWSGDYFESLFLRQNFVPLKTSSTLRLVWIEGLIASVQLVSPTCFEEVRVEAVHRTDLSKWLVASCVPIIKRGSNFCRYNQANSVWCFLFCFRLSGRKVELMAVVLRWEAVSSHSTPTGKPVRVLWGVLTLLI